MVVNNYLPIFSGENLTGVVGSRNQFPSLRRGSALREMDRPEIFIINYKGGDD